MTRIFAISGFSGTGKTTLVEKIIRHLIEKGYNVASVKSSKHSLDEKVGTDTWRHKQAGASLTIFLGPSEMQVTTSPERSLHDALMGREFDFLIVEGMKTSQIPKIWCTGKKRPTEDALPPQTKAIFAWDTLDAKEVADLPVLYSRDIPRILEIVLEKAVDMNALSGI